MSVRFSTQWFKLTSKCSQSFLFFTSLLLAVCSAQSGHAQTTSTNIQISGSVQQPAVHRLGVNLGDNGYWDSGQIMKNLVFENPGFEGLRYRVIFRCTSVTANTCTDDNQYNAQPAGYWNGASYLVMTGNAAGTSGTIVSNTAADICKSCGPTITFDQNVALAVGDYFYAVNYFPGTGDAGWADDAKGGGTITTETTDLSPNTPGKQAILLNGSASGAYAKISAGFDTWSGLSFIQLNGNFAITFRAKGVGGTNQLNVTALRLAGNAPTWLNKTITLTNTWQDYTLSFSASETGSSVGPVQLSFLAQGSSVELDDVSWQQTNSDPTNTTVFRDDVVNALRQLNPGTIRMMAAGAALGSDLPNQLQVPFARYRMGFNADGTSYPNISYGIHEFLQLCQAVGADPWITIPTATTPAEMTEFIQYLTGTGADAWSQLRINRGQSAPWTSVFNKIHLELGNETWNGAFKGESMNYPAYPQWANQVFGAARQTSGFKAAKFDLVLSGLAATPGYNQPMLTYSTQHDSFDVAPYLLFQANDESQSLMFGALFAEPEIMESPGGEIYQNMLVGAAAPSATSSSTAVSVYETNLGTMGGNITKAELDALTPSIGAGIAHTDHMLQMMRLGMQYQNAFSLPQYEYRRSDGSLARLWGMVVDMGTTNRRRPQFLTQAMANAVIGGTMMQTTQLGVNPTWNQPLSSDGVILNGAHTLQSFAFLNGTKASAIVFNLSQTAALPVTFSGENAPVGNVQMTQITSANITDNNEFADNVEPTTQTLNSFNANAGLTLPPFSMTVLTWTSSFTQAPNFSVAAGTFSTSQSVALSSVTANATIYYTTDGSKPTTSSTVYTGPIAVSKTQTINAIAVSANLSTSPVASATYVIQPVATAPTFSISTGIYNAGVLVVMLDIVPGSTIYYTTDGSTPTTSSNVYLLPVLVNSNQTLNAIAVAPNYTNSLVTTATYTIAPPTVAPVISVAPGTYQKTQYVKITDTQAGATVYCTSDGSTPVATLAEICTSGVTVSSSATVKAIAVAPTYSSSPVVTATYVIAPYVATPTLSVPGGTYNTPQTIAVSSATPGAVIYYTTDSSTPTTSSPKYTGPITISQVDYLQTMAVASGYTQSFAASANYVMTTGTPVISVSGSTVTLSTVTPGATIYYTTNGSAPSTSSTAYTGPFTVSGKATIKAMAGMRDWVNSAVASSTVSTSSPAGTTPAAATPVFSVNAGTYSAAQTVSISSATSGAKIYYTTNGATPTTASTLYSGAITVSATETLEAIAVASGYNNSAVASAAYTISVSSAPVIIPPSALSINGSTTINGNTIVLTDGGVGQAGTAWAKTAVKINGFDTQFDVQLPTSAADGFTFTLQNSPKGQFALGGNTSGLGYQFITNSVAVAFNFYQSGVTNAQSVGVYTNGVSPQGGNAISLNGTGINLHSGDTFHVEIGYQGNTLGVKITDKVTGASVTESFAVNLPSNVGGSTAYVGFTASTGGQTAIQNISNWTYTPSN